MAELLWKPSQQRIESTNLYRFMDAVNTRYGREFVDYDGLYGWSIENISDFWAAMWDFGGIIASKPYTEVVDDATRMPGARWFSGAHLNFAENLLRYRDDRTALIFKGEGRPVVRMTYARLYDEVAQLADALKRLGIA
ncbi:MAG: acetyl-coenzyme A synthetase N-terminal domain-containing protein, partial [Desulfobacterales bacterium]|nr:acetyl-coenzyme A synthetase N-terminal domain-containing protein [Desulfobacterales bacterium]